MPETTVTISKASSLSRLAACGSVDGGVDGEGDWRHGWRVEDRGPPWRRPCLDGLGEGGSGEGGGSEALPLGTEPRAVGRRRRGARFSRACC